MFKLVIWRQAVDYERNPIENYEVSNQGKIRSKSRYIKAFRRGKEWVVFKQGKLLSSHLVEDYERLELAINGKGRGFYVHTLVALAFPEICGEYFEGAVVDHINAIRNDNRPENLHFVTVLENNRNPITRVRQSAAARKTLEMINSNSEIRAKAVATRWKNA